LQSLALGLQGDLCPHASSCIERGARIQGSPQLGYIEFRRAGVHRGIAQFMGYGSYSAAVAELSMVNGSVKVHRMVLALDCGHAVITRYSPPPAACR